MHLPTNAVTRAGSVASIWIVAGIAITLVLGVACTSAVAQAAPQEAPVAVPRSATQTAPATQSAEEVMWQQILALRQLPPAPAGTTQPLENPDFVKTLNQQLEKSIQTTNEFLQKYPKSEHAEEVQIQRLDTMRLLAVVNKQPLDIFQAEAQKVLKSDAPVNVRAAAEYMLMGIRMDEVQKELLNSQLSQEQREQAWKQRVTQAAREFIAKYPKTAFAERFYVLLIDSALQDENVPEARAILEEMRKNHPESPFLPEIASAIDEVAAATQPSATQPSATQPAATQPVAPNVPDIATRPVRPKAPATAPAGQ